MRTEEQAKLRQLMIRIAAGDKDALRELFGLVGGALRATAFKVTKSHAGADETVNALLYKIWREAETLGKVGNIRGYLTVSAYHYAIDLKRAEKATLPLEAAERVAPDTNPDEKIHIEDVLSKLSENERRILLLSADAGLTVGECAAVMGLSYFKARRLLEKAKQSFIRLYGEA